MNILVTGAKGMVGTALVNNLKNIKDGKNKTRPNIIIDEIFEYDIDSSEAELEEYCQKADFVFNLPGVNRPKNEQDFMHVRSLFRLRFQVVSATVNTAGAKKQAKICFLTMARKQVQRLRFTVFLI